MDSYSFSGSGRSGLFDPFSSSSSGGGFVVNGGPTGISQSLVLDSKKGELVKAPARVGKKGISEAKALAALKNHSEAERRRRERINAHLSTLRGLVPCNGKVINKSITSYIITQTLKFMLLIFVMVLCSYS